MNSRINQRSQGVESASYQSAKNEAKRKALPDAE